MILVFTVVAEVKVYIRNNDAEDVSSDTIGGSSSMWNTAGAKRIGFLRTKVGSFFFFKQKTAYEI